MEFAHYLPCPQNIAADVIAAAKELKEAKQFYQNKQCPVWIFSYRRCLVKVLFQTLKLP